MVHQEEEIESNISVQPTFTLDIFFPLFDFGKQKIFASIWMRMESVLAIFFLFPYHVPLWFLYLNNLISEN